MIKRYLMTSVSCLALTGVASAADMPVKAPPPVSVVSLWAGPYIGVNGGAVWHRTEVVTTNGAPSPYDSRTINRTGGTFGGQIGYNWQSQNFVFGLEADANWVGGRGSVAVAPLNAPLNSITYRTGLSWLATLRARAGVTLGTHTLVYATGGLAIGGVENDWRFTTGTCCVVSDQKTRVGWTAGGGIERFITNPHLTVKAEALYVDLGNETVAGTGLYVSRFKNTAVVGRLGLNLKW
jgi:outer membrane immunogenic protein